MTDAERRQYFDDKIKIYGPRAKGILNKTNLPSYISDEVYSYYLERFYKFCMNKDINSINNENAFFDTMLKNAKYRVIYLNKHILYNNNHAMIELKENHLEDFYENDFKLFEDYEKKQEEEYQVSKVLNYTGNRFKMRKMFEECLKDEDWTTESVTNKLGVSRKMFNVNIFTFRKILKKYNVTRENL